MSPFTDGDARDLVQYGPWKRYVAYLMSRYIGQQTQQQAAASERISGSTAELRFILQHPYVQARRESPIEALESGRWLRDWMELPPMVTQEELAEFRAWQVLKAETTPATDADDRDPLRTTKGRTSAMV